MRREKSVEEKPLAEPSLPAVGAPPCHYPVVSVAQIAALLLKENSGDYRRAAKAAIALLDACEGELTGRIDDPLEQASTELHKIYEKRDRAKPKIWTRASCAAYVTGKTHDIDARPLFSKLLKHYIRRQKAKDALGLKRIENDEQENELSVAYQRLPETTDKEMEEEWDAYLPRVRTMCDIWKDEFARWHPKEKSRKARESGLQGGRGKKKEHPSKKVF